MHGRASSWPPPPYESYGAESGTAITCIAFSTSLLFMIILERLASALVLLVGRLIWGAESCPSSCCIEEPMATLVVEGLGSRFQASSAALKEYVELVAASEEQGQRGSTLQGYASMQVTLSCH